MSGFEQSPFADPFADSSIREVTQSTNRATLDEYNPFGDASPPAVLSPVEQDPRTGSTGGIHQPSPQYSVSAKQTTTTTAELEKRQRELDARAEELNRREQMLRTGAVAGPGIPRDNNWPPLPSFVPFGPCFFQDISVEIPTDFQQLVTRFYRLWGGYSLVYLANMFVALAALIAGSQSFGHFGLSVVYLILFTPAAYICWFRAIYKAFRNDSSIHFMMFFSVFAFQNVVSAIHALGISDLGTCGFINGISTMNMSQGSKAGHVFVGLLMLATGICFSLLTAADFYLINLVHRLYKQSSTVSVRQAQQQFTTSLMQSKHVQNASADIASNLMQGSRAPPTAVSSSQQRY